MIYEEFAIKSLANEDQDSVGPGQSHESSKSFQNQRTPTPPEASRSLQLADGCPCQNQRRNPRVEPTQSYHGRPC